MSFTKDIKAQLSKTENDCDFCDIAELSAIVKLCASYRENAAVITTENEDVAKRIKELFGRVFSRYENYICKNGSFKFYPDSEFFVDNMAIRLLLFNGRDAEITPLDCCRGAYLRGAFMGGGSVSNPKTRYHMEFDTKYEGYAYQLKGILDSLAISSKITCRKGRYIVYIKEYEAIADALGAMGAVTAAMELYNISIEKELRNSANRQANCEIANIEKITKASAAQLDAIHKIEKTMGFDELPETLREIARIRKQYPEEGLREIGERLNPPLGKSGVNHRLKRIIDIAEKIK